MNKFFPRAVLAALLLAPQAWAQTLPSPQIATPPVADDSNTAVNSAWVRDQSFLSASNAASVAPVQSVVGQVGAITAAEIAGALANAALSGVALTGATIGGNPIPGISGTWTAGNCVQAGTLYTVVVTGAPCGSGSGSTYVLPDATTTTLGGVTVSTGLSATSGALSVLYGTGAGTAAQGNDARITGALQAANNLSDVASASAARTNLALGALATAAYPSAGIVQSSGTAFAPVTIGSGLAFASGTLSADALTGSAITTALGFTPYSAANPSAYIDAAGAPVQSVAGDTGAVTAAQIETAIGLASYAPLADAALTGATIGGNPVAGVSGTWTAGNCVEAGSLYTVVVTGAPCGSGSGSTYVLPDATTTTLGGVTVSTGLSATSGALSVLYGTGAGTAAQGNDARITGAVQSSGGAMSGALTVQPATLPAQAMQFGQGWLTSIFSVGSQSTYDSVGTAYTILPSQNGVFFLYYSTVGSGTITLPTGAPAAFRTAFYNASSAPITLTIAAPTGAHIFAPGWSYVTSGTLNPGEYASLLYDGVNWEVFSGSASPLGLGALSTAAYPAAGIVQSSGTAFAPVTIGSGLAFASGTLSADALTSSAITTALGFTPYSAANPSAYIDAAGAPVQSVAGDTGAVTAAQIETAIGLSAYAPLASPALSGTPTAPTAAAGTSTTQLATTAFVASAVSGVSGSGGYAPRIFKGRTYLPRGNLLSTTLPSFFTPSANGGASSSVTLIAIPIYLSGGVAPVALSVQYTSAPSVSLRLGIYADNAGLPGALVANADTGTLTPTAAGVVTGTLTGVAALPAGWYWLAGMWDGAEGANLSALLQTGTPSYGGNHPSDWGYASAFGAPYELVLSLSAITFGALPSTFPTPTLSTISNGPPAIEIGF